MRHRTRVALAALALLLAAGPAQAAPIAVSASLRVEIRGLAPVVTTSTGVVDVTGGVYTIPAGLVSLGNATVPVTATTAVNSLVATNIANLTGTFAPGGVTSQAPAEVCLAPAPGRACVSGGGIGGVMHIAGLVNVHVIAHIVVIPVNLLTVNLGASGSSNTPYTFDGAPWTTGTVKIDHAGTTFSVMGSSATGSLTLVSGSYLLTCGNLLPITASFTLTPLVPEPAALVLIAIGTAGLIVLRRRH